MNSRAITPADVVFAFFLIVLVVVPLPLGAFRPWSGMLAAALTGAIALAWGLVVLRRPETSGIGLSRLWLPITLYGAALAWGTVQTLPITPQSWSHPMWSQAELAIGALPGLVSMAPAAGREVLALLAANGIVFLLAAQMGRSVRRAGRLVETLAIGLGLIALYGLVVHLTESETIFWLDKWAYRGDLTATLVNRNHYASLAGLGLLCALAGVLRHLQRHGYRESLRRLLGGRDMILIALLGALVLNALALPFTHSRAGMATSILGVTALLVLARRRNWRRLIVHLAFVAALALIAAQEMGGRISELSVDAEQRMRVWTLSWDLLCNRPWLGYGLGAFHDAFQAIRPVAVTQIWSQAHNSWLELMIELGVPAALCMFLAAGWAWSCCLSGAIHRQESREFSALGAAAGLMAGAHALVDFNVQIPAVAFVLAALLGIGTAQSWSSRLGRVVE